MWHLAGVVFMLSVASVTLLATMAMPMAPSAQVSPRESVKVTIHSTPPGAQVIEEGQVIGHTPSRLRRPRKNATTTLTVKQAGYRARNVKVSFAGNQRYDVTLRAQR